MGKDDKDAADKMETYRRIEAYFYGMNEVKIDRAKALEVAQEAQARLPSPDPVLLAFQADIYLRTGHMKQADQLWKDAVQHGLFRVASTGTNPYAALYAGLLFHMGKADLTQNYTVACVWYVKACKEGVSMAQFNLGWLYEYGFVGRANEAQAPDLEQARYYYERAAELGNAAAQYNLAGLLTDREEARLVLVHSAMQGYELAARRLDQLFTDGSHTNVTVQPEPMDRNIPHPPDEFSSEKEGADAIYGNDVDPSTTTSKKVAQEVTDATVSNLIQDLLGEQQRSRWDSVAEEVATEALPPTPTTQTMERDEPPTAVTDDEAESSSRFVTDNKAESSSPPPSKATPGSNRLKKLLDESRQLRESLPGKLQILSHGVSTTSDGNDRDINQLLEQSRRLRQDASSKRARAAELIKAAEETFDMIHSDTVTKDDAFKSHTDDDREQVNEQLEEFKVIEQEDKDDQDDSEPAPMEEIQFIVEQNSDDEELTKEELYEKIDALLHGMNKVQINPQKALRKTNRVVSRLKAAGEHDPVLTAFQAECQQHLGHGAHTDRIMLQAVAQGLLQRAKMETCPYAQYFVGTLCEHGRGGALPSAEKAAVWYQQAASQGLARAYYTWGALYFHGQLGPTRDWKRAMRLYQKAALQGHALAQKSLAEMYENGFGVEKDLDKAYLYQELSANQGPAQTQVLRGALYEHGQLPGGVERAREWYEKAAAENHAGAQYHLGMLYEKGFVGAGEEGPDLETAKKYYAFAASQGHVKASTALDTIKRNEWIASWFSGFTTGFS